MLKRRVATDLPAPPDSVADLVAATVRFVEASVGAPPDLTQDTLPLLDHYAAEIPADTPEELLGLIVPAMGAYFGEVVRRHLGDGRWVVTDEGYEDWRLVLSTGLSFNPIAVALEVATGEAVDGWPSQFKVADDDRQAARAAADRLGEVPEEHYYTFGVRFEVLEAVHRALEDEHARRSTGES